MSEEVPELEPIDRYGYSWAPGTSDASIELACFRKIGFENDFDTGHTRSFHFERAVRLMFPEKLKDGRTGYVMSKWSERRIQSFCDPARKFQTWWGSKATGKSTDAAVIALVYYLSAPDCTALQICSTSKGSLMKRIWSEVVRFYQMYPSSEWPMEYFRGKPAFQYKIPDTKGFSEKAGIFGRALLRGTVDEAVGEIIGLHNEYNVLIIDELQASRWAGVQAFDNLDSGREAKFLGMGNPVSRLDPLGMASKPKKGWESISPALEEWETEKGWCLYFDGEKSPGVEDPQRFWYYITKEQLDTLKKDPGVNSPRYWTMGRGFIPPEGLIQTVFTESLVQKHQLERKVTWTDRPVKIAALDGSYTVGGDRAVVVTADLGITITGEPVIQFDKVLIVNIEVEEGQPVEYYIVERVKGYCMARGIPVKFFGMDTTAAQTALAAIFEKEWGSGFFRCQFGGAPIGEMVSKDDPRPAKDVYWNRVTELWYDMRLFAINNQVAGIQADAVQEACNRMVMQKGGKIAVETKYDYKARTGQSPDIFDGHVIIGSMARKLFNMVPGLSNFGDQQSPLDDNVARALDVDNEDQLYEGDPVPAGDDENDIIDRDNVL